MKYNKQNRRHRTGIMSDMEKRLEKVEEQCNKIPEIQQSLQKIEYELIGSKFGNRPSFRSRLESLEDDVEEVQESQSRTIKASTGGAGFITIIINAIKEFFI